MAKSDLTLWLSDNNVIPIAVAWTIVMAVSGLIRGLIDIIVYEMLGSAVISNREVAEVANPDKEPEMDTVELHQDFSDKDTKTRVMAEVARAVLTLGFSILIIRSLGFPKLSS